MTFCHNFGFLKKKYSDRNCFNAIISSTHLNESHTGKKKNVRTAFILFTAPEHRQGKQNGQLVENDWGVEIQYYIEQSKAKGVSSMPEMAFLVKK